MTSRTPSSARARHPRRVLRAGVLVLAVALPAACGRPFVDSRREAGDPATVGSSRPSKPVICYAKGRTSPEEVAAMANAVCARIDMVAKFEREDLMKCRLMQPARAFFACVAPDDPGAGTLPPGPGEPAGGRRGSGPPLDTTGAVYPGGALPAPPRLQ
ncbi:hypothetical protein [Roseospira navarrensis]|uniref:Uncharacterized protein n=1 Tax=Roseospira navarrensis TaxID=140058 RepID=A0A7X2D1R9_9PROT|nr:hypothetical protein [Roseospira navarrensis]MQX35454.1 hypothetical protein [Roseospira navarrensis]